MIYVNAMITMPFRIFVQIYKMNRLLFVIISSFFLRRVWLQWLSRTFRPVSRLLLVMLIMNFLLLVSCGQQAPDNRLSESKMSDLMTEVHLIDGYLSALSKDSAVKVLPVLYEGVFKKYGLDSVSFAENRNYYMGDPDLTERIYGKVKQKLEGYNREIIIEDSLINVRVQDSINRVYRLQKNADDMKNLISNVIVDTTEITYAEFARMFYDYSGLGIQVYGVHIAPVVEVPPIPTTDTIPSVDLNKPIDSSSVEKLPTVLPSGNLRPLSDTGRNVPRTVPNTLRPLQRPKLQ